jgi:hypothetical protein
MAFESRAGIAVSSARIATALLVINVGASLLACGSNGTASPPAPAGTPAPTSCQKTDRMGTYFLTWSQYAGGTCGPIAAGLVSLNTQPAADAGGVEGGATGCTVHTDVWSDGDCKNERTYTCVNRVSDSTQPGGFATITSDNVAVTRQETASGSTIDGTITVALDDPSGGCRSTYAVRYVRQ